MGTLGFSVGDQASPGIVAEQRTQPFIDGSVVASQRFAEVAGLVQLLRV